MRKRAMRKALSAFLVTALAVGSLGTAASAASGYLNDPDASLEREQSNAAISEYAATQGMVLLENNNNVLPISAEKGTKVALYGNGVYNTIKGGTGSGNVNIREEANILVKQGFEDKGYDIVNDHKFNGEATSFLEDRIAEYNTALEPYKDQLNYNYVHNEPVYADSEKAVSDIRAAAAEADTAIYVLARTSGEGSDRKIDKGDYYLSDAEKANLTILGENFENVIVVLNVGGIVDTNFFNGLGGYEAGDEYNRDQIPGLDALFLMSQAGMNEGYALVDVLNGTCNPSGKLTDTWAINYTDYPASSTISANDGDTLEEFYEEDIYVGYRYFDTFGVEVAYPFGYGLSYTDFEINTNSVTATSDTVTVNATVTNTGSVSGKEVVEVYFSAPANDLEKPFQELAAYKKVEVAAGESENVTISFDTTDMASYDEEAEAYILESGDYTIRVGNSSRNTAVAATITLDESVVTEYCSNELGLTKATMEDGSYDSVYLMEDTSVAVDMLDKSSEGYSTGIEPSTEGMSADVSTLSLAKADFGSAETTNYTEGNVTVYVSKNDQTTDSYAYSQNMASNSVATGTETVEKVTTSDDYTLVDVVNEKITIEQLVASMSYVELADLVEGGTYTGVTASTDNAPIIGNNADSVFGAAGETTSNLYNSRYIPNIVLSDGPAGIRITSSYLNCLPIEDGAAYDPDIVYYKFHPYRVSTDPAYYYVADITSEEEYNQAITDGEDLYVEEGMRYQYCTAFPVGTMLAQTWDPDVIESVGRAIGVEMLELGVTSLLAPGMNIHRDPICGRNYEYYSEDPLVSGLTASAITDGVQKDENGNDTGIGVTLKHFAFNNQEASRFGSNSVVSERAAREIYLKGFEIAVKKSSPMFIMSSYNQVNGISTFQHYGLLTEILKNEWGFDGFVMTDWYSTSGVKAGSQYYGKNVRSVLMYAGNDCEMPGKNETSLLSGLEDSSMRLGDLQKSAINMLNVIKRTAAFNTLYEKLVAADAALQANKASEAQAAAQAAQAAAEKAQADAQTAQASAETAKAAAEKAQAAAEAALAKAEALNQGTSATTTVKTTLKLAKKKLSLKVGKKAKIVAVASTDDKITYKSTNKKVATVTAKGVVKGKKKGTAVIKVTCNGVTKKVKVTVK